jgi:hypothetical protein
MEGKANRGDRAYRPGQLAPISGIYNVFHVRHRPLHEVVSIRGEEFPPCRVCGEAVRFYVAHVASHMTHDLDLTGLLSVERQKGRARAAGKRAG